MPVKQSILVLVASLALCFVTALTGSQFRPGEWYRSIAKPRWTPPNAVFAPVWTALYALMAIAAWLVWQQSGWHAATGPLVVFVVQLGLNAAWSYVFFGLHRIGLALIGIVALWLAIVVTLVSFWAVRPVAGILLVPYALWVGFATALNHAIRRLNR
jgi:translocator protein